MRTTGTPEPGSLISFCFSCIFCNSEEVGLFSILDSTTASVSSGKEEFTVCNWFKDFKPSHPPLPSQKSTMVHQELVETSVHGLMFQCQHLQHKVNSSYGGCYTDFAFQLVFFHLTLIPSLASNSLRYISFCIFPRLGSHTALCGGEELVHIWASILLDLRYTSRKTLDKLLNLLPPNRLLFVKLWNCFLHKSAGFQCGSQRRYLISIWSIRPLFCHLLSCSRRI